MTRLSCCVPEAAAGDAEVETGWRDGGVGSRLGRQRLESDGDVSSPGSSPSHGKLTSDLNKLAAGIGASDDSRLQVRANGRTGSRADQRDTGALLLHNDV